MRAKTRRYMESRKPGYYPYYKLQWWNPIMLAWQTLQKQFRDKALAWAAVTALPKLAEGQDTRLIIVEARGQLPRTLV